MMSQNLQINDLFPADAVFDDNVNLNGISRREIISRKSEDRLLEHFSRRILHILILFLSQA